MHGDLANSLWGDGRPGFLLVLATLILIGFVAAFPAGAQTTPTGAQTAPAEAAPPANPPRPQLSADELDKLVAPIALYPDALLAQVLMASAYPMDVVAADRFMQKNPKLTGDQMEQALQGKSWDMSVKTLTHFPSVLKYMDENLDWTQSLGDAFVNQQSDVMAAVQRMRDEAYKAGNLKSGPQQTVSTTNENDIVIQPTDGQTIYVPQYNPEVVYSEAPATTVVTQPSTTVVTQPSTTTVVTEPGYSSSDLVTTGVLSFLGGAVVGGLIGSNWTDWHGGSVYVPPYYGGGYGGWSGWGHPPGGYGYNGWGGNNNRVNIGNDINISNDSRRWQPNNERRSVNNRGGQIGNRTAGGNRDFGYANRSGGNQLGNRGQVGSNNAFSGGNRGNNARANSQRGAQSLNRPSNTGPQANRQQQNRPQANRQQQNRPQANRQQQNRPQANRPQQNRPQANRPQQNRPQANRQQQNRPQANRQQNRGGGANAFGNSNRRGFDRSASQRGRSSMRSAQRSGFQQRGGGGGRRR
jgi:hypothetical protein